MRRILIAIALTFSGAAELSAECAPPDNDPPELTELMEELRRAPDEETARILSAQIWTLWTMAPDRYAQDLLDEAVSRREAYDFAGALQALDALVDYCPAYAEGWNQRAFVNFLRQDYDRAADDLAQALTRRPDHFAALAGLALTLMGQGEQDAAQQALRRALDLNPWLPERAYLIPPSDGETEL